MEKAKMAEKGGIDAVGEKAKMTEKGGIDAVGRIRADGVGMRK